MEELSCLHTPGLCDKKSIVTERSFPMGVYYLLDVENLDEEDLNRNSNCNTNDDLENNMEVVFPHMSHFLCFVLFLDYTVPHTSHLNLLVIQP